MQCFETLVSKTGEPGDDGGGDDAGKEASSEDRCKPNQTKSHCFLSACHKFNQLQILAKMEMFHTVAAGDGGEVVAKEDEEDDLKEGGHAVHKVPCC